MSQISILVCCVVCSVHLNDNCLRNEFVTLSYRREGVLMKTNLSLFQFVIIRGRREGVRPNMFNVTLFTVFGHWRLPLDTFDFWCLDHCCLDYCHLEYYRLDYYHLDYWSLDYWTTVFWTTVVWATFLRTTGIWTWPQSFGGDLRALKEPSETIRNLHGLSGTFMDCQEPSWTARNL